MAAANEPREPLCPPRSRGQRRAIVGAAAASICPSDGPLFDKRKARPSELIATNELARRLSVHPMTIRRWRREGKIKPYIVGGYAVRYDYVQVLTALTSIPDERG